MNYKIGDIIEIISNVTETNDNNCLFMVDKGLYKITKILYYDEWYEDEKLDIPELIITLLNDNKEPINEEVGDCISSDSKLIKLIKNENKN